MELLRERQESRLRRGHRSPLAAGAKDGEGERPVDVVPRRDAAESEGESRLQTARWRRRIGENTVQPDRRGHVRLVGFRLAVEAHASSAATGAPSCGRSCSEESRGSSGHRRCPAGSRQAPSEPACSAACSARSEPPGSVRPRATTSAAIRVGPRDLPAGKRLDFPHRSSDRMQAPRRHLRSPSALAGAGATELSPSSPAVVVVVVVVGVGGKRRLVRGVHERDDAVSRARG